MEQNELIEFYEAQYLSLKCPSVVSGYAQISAGITSSSQTRTGLNLQGRAGIRACKSSHHGLLHPERGAAGREDRGRGHLW